MTHIPHADKAAQDNPLDVLASIDPTILAELLGDGLTWIVAWKNDAKRLQAHRFPVVCCLKWSC